MYYMPKSATRQVLWAKFRHNNGMKNKFKERLKECRLNSGLTQKELAQKLGFSRTNISDWESGREPSFDTVIKIAKFFGESIDYMFGVDDIEL